MAHFSPAPSQTSDLLFIDTNIYLDFYRARNEAGLTLLNHLNTLRERIISTYQIEMEFKKNRQTVILESYIALKPPEHLSQPAFLAEAASVKALKRNVDSAKKRVKALKLRLKSVLAKPTTHDPVYKVTQRIFMDATEFNLTRDKDIRYSIRRLAFKRFILGYPPRKKNDTSTGDAVNWEWVIRCAEESGRDVILVSRDSDYGVTVDDESFLNDWLQREFKERISRRRQIKLTHKLSQALKWLSVAVSKEEEEEENRVLSTPFTLTIPNLAAQKAAALACELCHRAFDNQNRGRAYIRHGSGEPLILCPTCYDLLEDNAV